MNKLIAFVEWIIYNNRIWHPYMVTLLRKRLEKRLVKLLEMNDILIGKINRLMELFIIGSDKILDVRIYVNYVKNRKNANGHSLRVRNMNVKEKILCEYVLSATVDMIGEKDTKVNRDVLIVERN